MPGAYAGWIRTGIALIRMTENVEPQFETGRRRDSVFRARRRIFLGRL